MLTMPNQQKRSLLRFLSTTSISVLIIASTLVVLAHSSKPTRADSSFSFTAAGDYGQTSYTTANLNYIGGSGARFNLALGDLNYDPTHTTADAYSNYVKSHLPPRFPFEIIAGNEDNSELDALAANLPDQLGNISGTYAKQYYFDYPSSAPLARFILVSPGWVVSGYGNYSKGSVNYNWVAKTIDSARSAHIPWVIVGMHKYCIAINGGGCASQDLMNLLLTKKVDLILQAHRHNYQVSKQLALNSTTCTSLAVGSYNANCVVNDTINMTKGAGSVVVITGTGGEAPLWSIFTSDPQTGYFRNWMGANVSRTWGLSQFTVFPTQLTMRFIGVSSGTFSDSFTIKQ